MAHTIRLRDLGLAADPGRDWHPTAADKFCPDGTLPDLNHDQAGAHRAKPEATHAEGLLEAEASAASAEGVV